MTDPKLASKFRGCLLGGAVGDALGYPVEFWNDDDILNHFGDVGIATLSQAAALDGTPQALILVYPITWIITGVAMNTAYFIERNQDRLRPRPGFKNDSEPMAVIAAYIDYLMNLEENKPTTPTAENTAISRWRAFGLQKGVLRV